MAKDNKKKIQSLKKKTYQVQRNTVKEAGKIQSKRKWYDYKGNFFIIPSIMYEKNIDLNVDVKVNRLIIAIGYHRWSFDFGFYNPILPKKIWDKSGVDDFLSWAKLKTDNNYNWTIKDIESVLNLNKKLKELIYTVGIKKHYIRLILLRDMLNFRNNLNINDNDPEILKQEKIKIATEKDDLDDVLDQFQIVIEKKSKQ